MRVRERERKKEYASRWLNEAQAWPRYRKVYLEIYFIELEESIVAKEKGKKRESCTDVTRNDLFRSETADSDGIRIRNRKQRGVSRRARFTENCSRLSLPFFLFSFRDVEHLRAGNLGWKGKEEETGGGRRKRWEAGTRRAKWEAGRRQAMDEMLTRRETIDYSRRGRREGGCSRAWNGFPLPLPDSPPGE